MKTRNTRYGTLMAALAWLASAATAQAGEGTGGRFVMTVYEDMAQGRAILEGSPADTIEAITREASSEDLSFHEYVNLCVALTQLNLLEEAARACDAAVIGSHRESRRIKHMASPVFNPTRHARDVLALALTNRGVLHAVAGEQDKARELFEEALDLQPRRGSAYVRSTARDNLALLGGDVAAAR